MAKSIHVKGFDHGTLSKLELFEKYIQRWLPIVVSTFPSVTIIDLFAGPGFDSKGIPGSPVRILTSVEKYLNLIIEKGCSVTVTLNTYDKSEEQKEYKSLCTACAEFKHLEGKGVILNLLNGKAEQLLPKIISEKTDLPMLLLIDQYGVQFMRQEYLRPIMQLPRLDVIYFVSTGHLYRLGNRPEFGLSHLDIEKLRNSAFHECHKVFASLLKGIIPGDSNFEIHHFTLKKDRNINGVIFGASHMAAIDRFLAIAWQLDPVNGEGNFVIEDNKYRRRRTGQASLFPQETKIDIFQDQLASLILNRTIRNNQQATVYTYDEGHLPSHAAKKVMEMKRNGEIDYMGISPMIGYEQAYKQRRHVEFKVKS